MHCDACIFKPVRRKPKARLQAANSGPPGFENLALGGASRFHRTQRASAFLTVIAGEQEIPQTEKESRTQRVNENQSPDESPRCESYVLGRHSGNSFLWLFVLDGGRGRPSDSRPFGFAQGG